MAEESRLGPAVRERTKLLASLLRTPDDKLLTFIQSNGISEDVDVGGVRQVRDIMDALGKGLSSESDDPFWTRLDAASAALSLTAAVRPSPANPPAAVSNAPAGVQPSASSPPVGGVAAGSPTAVPASTPALDGHAARIATGGQLADGRGIVHLSLPKGHHLEALSPGHHVFQVDVRDGVGQTVVGRVPILADVAEIAHIEG